MLMKCDNVQTTDDRKLGRQTLTSYDTRNYDVKIPDLCRCSGIDNLKIMGYFDIWSSNIDKFNVIWSGFKMCTI